MRIDQIRPLTKTQYQVEFSDGSRFRIYQKDLKVYGFQEGEVVEESTYAAFREAMRKRATLYAMHLLEDMDRTQAQLLQKLSLKGYPEEIAQEALDYVKSFGYVNDDSYIRRFAESRMGQKSRKEIYALLLRKGLDGAKVKDVLAEVYQEGSEKQAIERILEKKGWDPEGMDEGKKQKMYAYLVRKGFRYEDIRQVIQVSDSNA